MRKFALYISFLFTSISFLTSCSSDDNSGSSLNTNEEKIIGIWGPKNGDGSIQKQFVFKNNKKVEYYTYWDEQGELEEVGNWSMNGDVLTMVYPETVELKYIQKVTFINDNEVTFTELTTTSDDAWEGTYFKQN